MSQETVAGHQKSIDMATDKLSLDARPMCYPSETGDHINMDPIL